MRPAPRFGSPLAPSALLIGLLLLAGCNSPGASASATSGGSTAQSSEASNEASASTDGGGGGGGTGNEDIDAVADALAPPNGTEQGRYSASGALIVSWTSTDSVDSLKSYYDGKVASIGYEVLSTTDVQGTHGWVFGHQDGSGVSGALTIAPGDAGATAVSLTVGVQP